MSVPNPKDATDSSPTPPQPEDFGLTTEEARDFDPFYSFDDPFEIGMKIGLVVGLLFSFLVPFWAGRSKDFWFWVAALALGPVAGMTLVVGLPGVGPALGYGIKKVQAWRRERRTR